MVVKEGLAVNSIHAVKGENYTGDLASRIHYNDGQDTGLPAGSTVEWKNNQAPDYNNVGTSRYTLVVKRSKSRNYRNRSTSPCLPNSKLEEG
ncbi:hypothetical protein AK85_04935 [Streptococcus pneumoniae B1598]|nr:hypothetical protein AK85_04935 [Streptococcus pneumoniae B1598]